MKEEKIMFLKIKEKNVSAWPVILIAVIVIFTVGLAFGGTSKAMQKQKMFNSPEEAMKAAVTAAKSNDDKELIAIFGASAKDLLFSGDAVADKQRRERFLKAFDEKNSLVSGKGGMVLVIGNNDWPFPIPIVKKGETWFFDTDKGREEILNRRIGDNELSAIQTMLAIVDAQREYAKTVIASDGIPEYARKFVSDQGTKNGLYWETKEGENPSPIGPALAKAKAEGYKGRKSGDEPSPFHGYYFRILTAQGKKAPGGAFDYIVKGKMIGGFAVIAFPAIYGNSGVMTFVVNHDGVVYQKDLGKNTEKIAKAMTKYDPDKTWGKAQ